MHLRRATIDDALVVLEWRSDPISVSMSKTGAVDPTGHLQWFAKAINDPARIILIATEEDRRIGMIRLDRQSHGWLVSINVAPNERFKGYGRKALQETIAAFGREQLVAEIKSDNHASIRMFERCGFRQMGSRGEFLQFTYP